MLHIECLKRSNTGMSERDTHFQNAASFLVQEMRTRGFIADDTSLQHDEMHTLIAQHDYDVAQHSLRSFFARVIGTSYYDPEEIVRDYIPDLTQWPEQT
jgi:hypothetical protein